MRYQEVMARPRALATRESSHTTCWLTQDRRTIVGGHELSISRVTLRAKITPFHHHFWRDSMRRLVPLALGVAMCVAALTAAAPQNPKTAPGATPTYTKD